jgi:hypothetical protein
VPQVSLAVEGECEADVSLQVALVELVEDHAGDTLERGVVLQHSGQDALGDDLDARARADAGLEARAIADAFAVGFPEQPGHAPGDRARGDAARLQHHDAPVLPPRRIEQHQRHQGALAGPGRGLEHGLAATGQGRAEFRQRTDDR